MNTAMKTDKSVAEEYVRNLFNTDPYLSIDEVARLLDKGRFHRLHKSDLARIRIFVKQQLASQGKLQALPPQIRKKNDVFNPPRLAIQPALEQNNVQSTTGADMGAAHNTPHKSFRPSSKKERADFLYQWADKHPHATIVDARKALLEEFGMAVGTAFIAETLKFARQVHGVDPKPQEKPLTAAQTATVAEVTGVPVPAPAPVAAAPAEVPTLSPHSIQGIVQAMKALGLKKVELKEGGNVSFEAGF